MFPKGGFSRDEHTAHSLATMEIRSVHFSMDHVAFANDYYSHVVCTGMLFFSSCLILKLCVYVIIYVYIPGINLTP